MKLENLSRIALWALLVASIVATPPKISIGKMAPVENISCKEQISRASTIFSGIQKSFEMLPPDLNINNLEGKAGYIVEKVYKGIIPEQVEVVFPARQKNTFSSYPWSAPRTEGIIALNKREGNYELAALGEQCKDELLTLDKSHDSLDHKITLNPNELANYFDKIALYERYKDYANAVQLYESILNIFPDLKADNALQKSFHRTQRAEICETRVRRMGNYFNSSRKTLEYETYVSACMEENPPR